MDAETVWLEEATLNFEIDILVWEGFQKLQILITEFPKPYLLDVPYLWDLIYRLLTYYKPDIFGCLEGENIFKKLFLKILEWSFKLSQNDFNGENGRAYLKSVSPVGRRSNLRIAPTSVS